MKSWKIVAAIIVLLLTVGVTCTDGAHPNVGNNQHGSVLINLRLWVTWKARAEPGVLTISYSGPEFSNTKHIGVDKAGKWHHDEMAGTGEGISADVNQTTDGVVSCWFEEVDSSGRRLGQLGGVNTITKAGEELDCTYIRPVVD